LSKKGANSFLDRLIKVTEHRLPFQAQAECLRSQRQWLFDLDHLLELEQQPKPTRQSVSQAVDSYLNNLLEQVEISGTDQDKEAASQINQTFRNLWWGLFTCYEVEGLPRTNNDLERFLRRMKMGQRRISGRKNVHDFILRYGSFAAFVDYAESESDVFQRLSQVTQVDFLKERNAMNMIIVKEQKVHRFRFHREAFLADLESRWDQVVAKSL